MPATRHLPGSGSTPDRERLDAVTAVCPLRTDPLAWSANAAWLYGWRLLAGGFYWEAHEAWEPVWQRCAPNSRERLLVQALIQLANALLKRRLGRERACVRLLGEAAGLLDELSRRGGAGRSLMGVDIAALCQLARTLCAK